MNGTRSSEDNRMRGDAPGDADALLTRMDDKIRALKTLVCKQQSTIDALRAENTALETAREALLEENAFLQSAQQESSAEVSRLCEAAAASAEAVAALQQAGRHASHPAASPKHVVVDTRRARRHHATPDVPLSPVRLGKENASDRVCTGDTPPPAFAGSAARVQLNAAAAACSVGGGAENESSFRSSKRMSRRSRVVDVLGEQNADGRTSVREPGHFDEAQLKALAAMVKAEDAYARNEQRELSFRSTRNSDASPTLGKDAARTKGQTNSGVGSLYDSSRSAARMAWGMIKPKAAGQ